MTIIEASQSAKKASIHLAAEKSEIKNKALRAIAGLLDNRRDDIKKANEIDLERSKGENLADPLIKRLAFGDSKIDLVIQGIEDLAAMEDPVGKTQLATELDAGLELFRVSCPIGVIGVIFESRPDALVQISTLCLKSGNAVLLKGGSEAKETNRILAEIITEATIKSGIAEGWLHLLETRDEVTEMLSQDDTIDLIIPRGSNEFVQYIMHHSNIPVMGHADGICHLYIDEKADIDMAVNIAFDAKTQYVAVCNAVETILVHEKAAPEFLPRMKEEMGKRNVIIHGCGKCRAIIDCQAATEDDWKTEYLDYEVAVRVVTDMEQAIDHINTYGSGHTDAIVTNDEDHAVQFMQLVDSGNVFWNVSTRFSDGFVYGFGAEVGISTNKIHARGPVGLDGLLIYKYKLFGNGHLKATYSGDKAKQFTHRSLDKELKR